MATPRKATQRSSSATTPLTLVLNVTLRDVQPACWRGLVVDGRMTLDRLHRVIQTAFGWGGGHLHEFWSSISSPADHRRFGPPDPFGDRDPSDEVENSARIKLSSLFARRGAKLYYIYDFGDNWEHEIKCEKLIRMAIDDLATPTEIDPPPGAARSKRRRVWAFCIDGAGRTPPDDCGGPWGYEEMLEILADPTHEEHDTQREWLGLADGDSWDPKAFQVDDVNEVLAMMH